MNTIKKYFKPITHLLIVLLLFQGCAVYEKAPVTIETAAQEGYPVKVKTIYNKSEVYHHIELKDGIYYGVKHVDREQINVLLKKGEINSIHLMNKKYSTAGNAAIVAPILLLVLLAVGGVSVAVM